MKSLTLEQIRKVVFEVLDSYSFEDCCLYPDTPAYPCTEDCRDCFMNEFEKELNK